MHDFDDEVDDRVDETAGDAVDNIADSTVDYKVDNTVDNVEEAAAAGADFSAHEAGPEDDPAEGADRVATARVLNLLEQRAQRLAAAAAVTLAPVRDRTLLDRLPQLSEQLEHAARHFRAEVSQDWISSYAGEWVLDNLHIIQQALRQIQEDLPAKYYGELPKVTSPVKVRDLPRMYAVVRAYLAHDECQLDLAYFIQFLNAAEETYAPSSAAQDSSAIPFSIGEIWAVPIMLRYVLLEDLADAAARIIAHEVAQEPAETPEPDSLLALDPSLRDTDIVADAIRSLRRIDTQDWDVFFEEVSRVHAILCNDPAGVYPLMAFDSRNRYRSVIERLARHATYDEVSIARAAVELAREAVEMSRDDPEAHAAEGAAHAPPPDGASAQDGAPRAAFEGPRTGHVGHYLVDAGWRRLAKTVRYRTPIGEDAQRFLLDHPTAAYLGLIAVITLAILAGLVWYTFAAGGWLAGIGVGMIALVPAITLAVDFAAWLFTHTLAPRVLPRLDFSKGIPTAHRAMVVIPALISHVADIEPLVRQLELHYLRNADPNLGFALLGDLADAPAHTMPEDELLMVEATAAIDALNRKYADAPFFLFHRERRWNPAQGVWMCWERKRGNLHEFNRLIRQGENAFDRPFSGDSYIVKHGRLALLPSVRYVITLDADTVLPAGAAHHLVGALAHPLNRATFDPETGRLTAGYTILQPRAESKPTSAGHSLFSRIFSANTGIDLYTLAVSDVYQDLFGAGIYVGKGIYDVAAFERALADRVPENALLSHDLFEGIHGRVGLVTEVVVYEDLPPHYLINVLRTHRWVRGDWQLLPWLMPRTPRAPDMSQRMAATEASDPALPSAAGAPTERTPNDLALIDLWKIADNLRRSLVAPALLLLFVAGWTVLPGSPVAWTLIGLALSASGLIMGILSLLVEILRRSILRRPMGRTRAALLRPRGYSTFRWLLFLAFLPYESLLTLDAIARTLYRLAVSRRRLLEWTTAAHTVKLFGDEVSQKRTLQHMWSSMAIVAVLTLIIIGLEPGVLPLAFPFLLLWLFSPEIAYRISRPPALTIAPLHAHEQARLRRLARRTWLFYEQYVGPEDNWLAPDHFQESPLGVVAHYTSPTNTGMYIVSLLAAYDLGYIVPTDLSVRLRATFATLARLERYRGHFLNWINTESLDSLPPRYVSTVDSGNLAACLIVLKQTCLNLGGEPLWTWTWWEGLLDTLGLLEDTLAPRKADTRVAPDSPAAGITQSILAYLLSMQQRILAVRETPSEWYPLLVDLARARWQDLQQRVLDLVDEPSSSLNAEALHTYRLLVERIRHHLGAMTRELETLQPWLVLQTELPSLLSRLHDIAGNGPNAAGDDLAETWAALATDLSSVASLQGIATVCTRHADRVAHIEELLAQEEDSPAVAEALAWLARLRAGLESAETTAATLLDEFSQVAQLADTYVQEMEFGFLFHQDRQVFHIGYNIDAGMLDNSFYDLMASEARIASLIAIAKHDAPQSHWLHLGRSLTTVHNGEQALLSWNGTMFEYLLPTLLARSYPGTLLDQSVHSAVEEQMAYGRKSGAPWGISESGFYAFDNAHNYQYRAFGVPTLGFKRGLEDDLVIAPYASLMALPIRPHAVLQNMDVMEEMRLLGRSGFYEAADFTPARLEIGADYRIVRSYMAHHQGMIMLALANVLHGNRMVERFHSEPMIQSIHLLLQEQIPTNAPHQYPHQDQSETGFHPEAHLRSRSTKSWQAAPDTDAPQVHILSNGSYSLIIGATGSGFSRWNDLQLTRWRSDPTLEETGSWLYVQEMGQDGIPGELWSATRQPVCTQPDHETVTFHPYMVEFRRRDNDITTHMRVTVSVNDDIEIRHVTVTNDSNAPRRLRLVTYGEVVLAPPDADQRHPAFVKLFVESEYAAAERLLLFRRRPRAAGEATSFLGHTLVISSDRPGVTVGRMAYESDRMRFLGRGRDHRSPAALAGVASGGGSPGGLTGTTGATLDPIFAVAQEIELAPHASADLAVLTASGPTRRAVTTLLARYRSWSVIERAFVRASSQMVYEALTLELEERDLEMFSRLLSLLLYPDAARRAESAVLAANRKGQSGLWTYGISGDYPILLVRIGDESEGRLLQQVLKAHTYWRRRNFKIDIVILNQQETNYGQGVRGYIMRMIQRAGNEDSLNQRGGLFVLTRDQVAGADQVLLQAVARVILDGERGLLAQQVGDAGRRRTQLPKLLPPLANVDPETAGFPLRDTSYSTPPVSRPDDLQFDNGVGGFGADGKEYVIYLPPGSLPPAPWINVIANPDFGFLVSASGGGYTWAINSGENRLTTWRNDPVSDPPAEALYLRDEETAVVWSPTPRPAPGPGPYLARHGAGYTVFEHNSYGLAQQLRLFAAVDAPVKVVQLQLTNLTTRPRRITATYYAEWVLGAGREETQQHIVPEYEGEFGALLARNSYSAEFGERVAFVAGSKEPHGVTADRTEFLGRCGTLQQPEALTRIGLGNRVEAGLDPCAALQLHIDLPPEATTEVYFLVGQGADRSEAIELIRRFRAPEAAAAAWQAVHDTWDAILGAVTVETPDPAMNLLLNRWLLYQSLACRVWGRSAHYQSSGAFGFRDQLQDVMSLVHTRPDETRAQILRAARCQFETGDVLHWWHEPSGRGLRTRISDNLLWLPYVTAHYIHATGDTAILEEEIPFLMGDPLRTGEEERYGYFPETQARHTLLEHCRRALAKGTTAGAHGIPLMGAGDWNDGMNRVGAHGRGESIWLGWFLCATLRAFADLCDDIGRPDDAEGYREEAARVREAVEVHGWDGEWYLRAYDDEGAPLGSAQNTECRIDAIAQAWSVLSGAGDPERRRQAMASALDRLVRWDDRLILLLTPPFDKGSRDPGYIKGYVPGIRENGGQYTHAALWTIWAFAELGEKTLPEQLFRLINPIYRADSPQKAALYRVEPYVIAADVYGVPPHTGRGGWTWYTGSAGWMYRLGLEGILGLTRVSRRGARYLRIAPCIPDGWSSFRITYRLGGATYEIQVDNTAGSGAESLDGMNDAAIALRLDGQELTGNLIPLHDDGQCHQVLVTLR